MSPTAIEWTEETWNPVTGCTKVSAGCDNCYAERITNRFGGPGAFDEIKLHPDRLEKPLHWRKPRTVFVNSMSDLFHADVPMDFIAQVWDVMVRTPQHTYQVLTKRPGRARLALGPRGIGFYAKEGYVPRPQPNIWLGVSVEDQDAADARIPVLVDMPAAVRFLSCEPLLAPLTLHEWLDCHHVPGENCCGECECLAGRIGWVIVGGESGISARPMDPAWAHKLRDECVVADVPFFFKQWGGRTPKSNGRELDGRTWDEMPGRVA